MNPVKIFSLLLFSLLVLNSCNDDEYTWTDIPNNEISPITSHNKVIYEVNVYSYSSGHNFKGLENDLPRLKELGVDVLWLMPIHPRGEENRAVLIQ